MSEVGRGGVGSDVDSTFEYGELRIDTAAHEVTIGPTPVELRRLEYALLVYLALAAADDDEQPERANTAELDALRTTLQAALRDSTPARTKAVLQAMIDGIRVDERDHIEPTFRVPAVRIDYGYMELVGLEPTTFWLPARRSSN